jgi:hypothetical protein
MVDAKGLRDATFDYDVCRVRYDNWTDDALAGDSRSENKDCRSDGY